MRAWAEGAFVFPARLSRRNVRLAARGQLSATLMFFRGRLMRKMAGQNYLIGFQRSWYCGLLSIVISSFIEFCFAREMLCRLAGRGQKLCKVCASMALRIYVSAHGVGCCRWQVL